MAKIDELFKIMVQQGASDLHISTGSPPILRLHGEMEKLKYRDLTNEECKAIIYEILSKNQIAEFEEKHELDTSYHIEGVGRFRVNVFMQRRGIGAVYRAIPETILTVEQLNLPQSLLDLINCSKGLILVTGPTGSGKSTTLAALIDHINKTEQAHILTVEDPVEFVHQNQKSLINQREVKLHTESFANALKAALREDPDVILVGEMRDLETISLAMTAAETGHLVFGTLHTSSAPKTVDRIIDVFPPEQQAQIRVMLSESLRGVIAQGLLPRRDKPGRVAVLEVLKNTKAVGNLIREGKTFQLQSVLQTGTSEGMIPFEMSIKKLLAEGKINEDDASSFLGYKIKGSPQMAAQVGKPETTGASGSSNQKATTPPGTGPAPQGVPTLAPQTPGQAPQGKLSNMANSLFKKNKTG